MQIGWKSEKEKRCVCTRRKRDDVLAECNGNSSKETKKLATRADRNTEPSTKYCKGAADFLRFKNQEIKLIAKGEYQRN